MADNKLVTEYTIKAKLDKGTIKQDGESIRKYIESIGDKTINIDFKTSNLKEVEKIIADMSDGDADVAALIRRAVGKQKVTRSTASLQGWKRLKEVIDFSPDDAGVVEEYTDRIQNEIKKFKDQSIGMSGEALKQLESNLYDVIENMLQQVYSIRNISVKGKNFNAKEIYNKIANNALKDLQLNGLDSEQRISKFAHNPNSNKKINMFNYGYTNLDDVIKYLETFSSTMEEWANSVVTIIQDAKEEVDKETSGNKKDNSHKDNRSNGNNRSDNQNGNYSSIQTETLQATDIKATTIEVNEIITKGGQRPRGKNRKKETAIIDNFEQVINSLDGSEFLHRGTQYLGAYEPITKGEALNVIFRHALDSGTLGNIASGYGVNGTGLYATRDIASVENGGEGYYLIKTSDMKNLLRLSKHPESTDKGDLYWGDFPVSNIGSFKGAETTDLFYAYLQHKLETYMAYMGMTNNGLKVKPIRNSLIDTYGMNSALLNNDDSSINKVAEEFYNDYKSLLKETDHKDVTLDQFINFFKDSIKIQNEMYSHIGTVIDDFGDTVKSEYINDKNYDKWQADEKLYGWQSGHSAASSRVLNELFGIKGVIPEVGSFLDDYYHGAIFYDVPEKNINSIPFFDKSLANTIGSILQIKGKGASNSELQQQVEFITKGSNILAEFTSSSSGAGNIVNFVEQLSKLSDTLDKNVISYFAKLWKQYSKNAAIKKPFMPSIVGTENKFGRDDDTARAIRLFYGTDLSKINQGSIDEYLGAVKYLQQSGKTSHLTSIFNLLAELSSESKKIQATEDDVSNTWGNYSKAVKAIKNNIRNYTDYLEVISDIMYAVGNSDIGETAYNGNRAISYNQGGSVNTPGNKKMAIDYHSHPDRGYDNAIPSRQDIVSYFETINEQLDEYGQAYLKKAYISNGNKILEMGFDNIDWSKVDTGQLQEELYDAINNAVKESGGGSKLNDKGEEEWLLTHDINTNDRISKSVRAAMLSVLSKYGGGIRVATRNGNGDLIDDATKEKWIADVKSGTVLNQGTEENFKKSVDVFDEAVDKFSTGNSKKEATGTADPISLKAIDDFILQLRRELLITETNPNVSGNAVADSLRQLINRTLTFRSTSRMGFGEWDNIRGRFTTIQSQNDIVDANRDLYDELIKIDQTLITLRATGQAQTQEYRNLQAERRNTISRLDVGNRAGYLQNAANKNATLQVARTFFDRLTDIQNKTANIVNTKLNNGYTIDASFRQNYDRNNQSATRQLNALGRILNGDTTGIDITALFKRVVGVIDTLEQVQEDIKTNAVSMTRPIDSSKVSSRIRQFTSLGANEALKVDDNLRLQLNDYIERLSSFNATNREDNDAYELLVKEGDELREQINSLDLIIKKYKETYGLRNQIAKLEITGENPEALADYNDELEKEKNIISSIAQSFGIDDSITAKIFGDPSEYESKRKEYVTKLQNTIRGIETSKLNEEKRGYGYTEDYEKRFKAAKDYTDYLVKRLQDTKLSTDELKEALKDAYRFVDDINESDGLQQLKRDIHSSESVIVKRNQAANLFSSATTLLTKTSGFGVSKEDRLEIYKIYAELKNISDAADKAGGEMSNLNRIRYDELTARIKDLTAKYKELGVYGNNLFSSIGRTIKEQTISALSRYFSLYDIIRYVRTGVSTVKELDTAMVELRKVTDGTAKEYEEFGKTIRATAVEIASTNSNLIQSAADWARLGYSIKEATELARDAQIFVNVGDGVDIKGATDMMITAMKAFNIEAEDALSIVDRYNEIGNNFALSATDIGDAIQRSASVLAASNTSFDESIALITAGNEILQDPEKTGTALRTIALRIRGAKSELEEMGEETDGLIKSTSKLRELIKGYTSIGGKYEGFDIMEDENTFKSLTDIIKGIGEVYDEMSDIDRTAMLEKLAGKNRSNALAAMLQNYKQIDNVLKSIEESEGSAMEENAHIVDSIQGRMTQLQTAAENFWQAFLDTDLIKDAVSALTELLNKLTEFIDKHGSGELLAGIASIATLRFTGVGNGFINSIKTIIRSKVAISATQNALSQLTQGTEEYIQAEKELADLNTLCQGSFNSLKISVNKVIGALKKIGPVGWGVIAAITAISVVITELTKKEIKQIQKVKELADEYSSSTKELSKYKEKIGQLQSILRDESSTTDELIGAKEDLNKINEQLMSSYESLKGRIDLANMSLEDAVDLIDKLDQEKLNDIITAATGRESDFSYALSDGFDFTDLGKVFNGSRSELDRAINFYLNGLDARNNTTVQAGLSRLDTTKTAREQYAELLKLIDEQTAIILDENSSKRAKRGAEQLNSILLATKDAFDEAFEQLGNIEAAYGSTLLSKYEDAYSEYQNAELNYILDKSEETKNALSQALRDLWKTASEEDKVAIEEYMKMKYGESFGTPDDWNFDDYQNNRVFIRHATGSYIGGDSKNGDITNLLSFSNLDEALEYIIEKTGKELKSQEFIDWASVSDSELVSLRGHGADNEIDSGLILFRELVKTSGQDLDYFIDRLEKLGYSISPKEDYFRQYLEESRNESIAKFGSDFADEFDKLNLSTGTQIDIWNSIRDQATNAAEAVEMYRLKISGLEASTSATDVLKDMEEQYKPTFDAMAEAYKAIWDDKNVFQGMDKITSEQINSVRSQLESVNSSLKENGLDMIDSSEIDDFILTLSDADATADEVQDAFDNIATLLVDSLNPALGQASGETAELMQKTLTELGVTNAEAVVFSRLGYTAETYAKAKEAADAADIDLDAELSSLSDEELQIVANNEALMAYYNGKLLVGGAEITTPEEAQLLIDYCNQMGIAQLGTLNLASAERELRAAIDQTNEGIRTGNMELQARGEVGIANIIKQLNGEKAKVKFGAKTIFNGNENKSSSSSTKSSDSKQKFDWIERAIKKIQRAVTNLGKVADATYKSWGERLDALMGKTVEFNDEIGQFGRGNIDLYNRPQYINEDGSVSTVRSMSFGDEFGNEILVPTIAFDNNGNPYSMSDDEAIARYYETGEYLGLFKSIEEAEEYAEKLHEQQEAIYVGGDKFYAGKYQKLKEEIALQEQAAQAYMAEANAIGLSAEYRSKVMNGLMDIETITDEKLKEQISDFQELYLNMQPYLMMVWKIILIAGNPQRQLHYNMTMKHA